MLYRTFWLLGLTALILFNLVALWEVSYETCGDHTPILLSRALTTDPYRGITLAFCLLTVASSLYFNSILVFAGFLGFFSAFLVSMFQTNAHSALIVVSSLFILYETWPSRTNVSRNIIYVHWCLTALAALVCVGWMTYKSYHCDDGDRCSKCSWWYISEYVFFWSLYGLVYWRIPASQVWRDQVEITPSAPPVASSVPVREVSARRPLHF